MERRTYLTAIASIGTAATAGCTTSFTGGGDVEMPVEVVLTEWRVEPETTTLPAGEVEFKAKNEGEDHHELVVRQREEGSGRLRQVGEVDDIGPGTFDWLTVDLEPGAYELCCLMREEEEDGEIEDHYRRGMHTTVTVEE